MFENDLLKLQCTLLKRMRWDWKKSSPWHKNRAFQYSREDCNYTILKGTIPCHAEFPFLSNARVISPILRSYWAVITRMFARVAIFFAFSEIVFAITTQAKLCVGLTVLYSLPMRISVTTSPISTLCNGVLVLAPLDHTASNLWFKRLFNDKASQTGQLNNNFRVKFELTGRKNAHNYLIWMDCLITTTYVSSVTQIIVIEMFDEIYLYFFGVSINST